MKISNTNKKLMASRKKRYTPPLPLNADIHVDRKKFLYELAEPDTSTVENFVASVENKCLKRYYAYAKKFISSINQGKKISPPKEPCYVKTYAASVFKSERLEI